MRRKNLWGGVALACYITAAAASLVLAAICFFSALALRGGDYEGWEGLGAGLGMALLLVFAIIALSVMLIELVPLVLRCVALKRGGRGAVVACIVFDVLFVICAALMSVAFMLDAGLRGGMIISLILAFISAVALVANIVSLKK